MGIGTTRASFQSVGNVPVVNDRLKRFIRLGAISGADNSGILGKMLSGPEDLEASNLVINSATCSIEQRYSVGKESESRLSNGY